LRKSRLFTLLMALVATAFAVAVAPSPAQAVYRTYISVRTPDGSSGKRVIDVRGASYATRAETQLWTLNHGNQQYWDIRLMYETQDPTGVWRKFYQFRNARSELCLDKSLDNGNANGAAVYQYPCRDDAPNQHWYYVEVNGSNWGYLKSASGDRCLDARGPSFTDGARLQVYDCTGAWNQRWNIQP
jgi:hypothetical protein